MKTSKSLGTILGAAILGAGLLFAPVKKADAGFYFYGSGEFNFSYGTPIAKITTMPEYIRNVPPHPDDSIKTTYPGVIADRGELAMSLGSLGFETRIGFGIKTDYPDFDLKIGPKLNFEISSSSKIAERNYLNHPGTDIRGEGAALTYYNFAMGRENSSVCIVPGISVKGSIGKYVQLFTEYSADWYEFFVQNGWDRYNRLEVKDAYKIAESINHSITLGVGLDTQGSSSYLLEGFVGITIPQIVSKTPLADQTGFSVNPNFFFGIKGGGGFDFPNNN